MSEFVTIHCDIYHRTEKVGRLDVENGRLERYEVYTSSLVKRLCPEKTSLPNILAILTDRVICPERCDEGMLNYLGVKEYNAYDILKKTHGVDSDDFMWLKFDGEDITWDDVKVRG